MGKLRDRVGVATRDIISTSTADLNLREYRGKSGAETAVQTRKGGNHVLGGITSVDGGLSLYS